MEFLDRVLGITKREQEKVLQGVKIEQTPRKMLVGPDSKEALVVDVSNEEFLRLISEKKIKQYQSYTKAMSDTHNSVELFLDLGKGVKVETKAAEILSNNRERNILDDLRDMNFSFDPKEDKSAPYIGFWRIYRLREGQNV